MTEQQEKELRKRLNNETKENIIDLFIKLRKNFDKSQERLYKIEEKLIEKTSLDELIEDIEEMEQKNEN